MAKVSEGCDCFPFSIVSLENLGLHPGGSIPLRKKLAAMRNRQMRVLRAPTNLFSTPELARAYAIRGIASFCAKKSPNALADINRALSLETHNLSYRLWRAVIEKGLGKWDAAFDDFSAVILAEPGACAAYFGRAEVLKNRSDWQGALADALVVVRLRPDQAVGYRLSGRIRIQLRKISEGLNDLDRAVRLEPESAEGYAWRGEAYRKIGEPEKALKDFNSALRIHPPYAPAYVWRGILKMDMGRKGSLSDFQKAVRCVPRYAMAHAWAGKFFTKQGHYERAKKAINYAVGIDPDYAWAYYQRFVLWRKLGNYRSAIADLNKAALIDPKYTWLEPNAQASGNFPVLLAEAARELDMIVLENPQEPGAYFWRARTHLQAGRMGQAVLDFERAASLDSTYVLARLWRGKMSPFRAISSALQEKKA